uniref:Uncharacterized protein n=1 Tax=Cyanistes caeruleus TaxID=156563 RepID=A0A8C0ZF48_CYACU
CLCLKEHAKKRWMTEFHHVPCHCLKLISLRGMDEITQSSSKSLKAEVVQETGEWMFSSASTGWRHSLTHIIKHPSCYCQIFRTLCSSIRSPLALLSSKHPQPLQLLLIRPVSQAFTLLWTQSTPT